jgi:hypothetical protein
MSVELGKPPWSCGGSSGLPRVAKRLLRRPETVIRHGRPVLNRRCALTSVLGVRSIQTAYLAERRQAALRERLAARASAGSVCTVN